MEYDHYWGNLFYLTLPEGVVTIMLSDYQETFLAFSLKPLAFDKNRF
ncbi:hypothetical protein OHJ21_30550 [Virgibacillus sp. LDC1]|nr:hypothetical protein [Paenibacillus sp. GM2FR]MCV4235527.1 hypothetical protein [Virgibacillus sp. LDC1]PJN49049.1 hypothetical protein PAEVO_57580 [Paenibacillus sp. GM2FR]